MGNIGLNVLNVLYEVSIFYEHYKIYTILNMYYIISSPVVPTKKLMGLAEIRARVVSGFGLIYSELLFRPGPSSQVGYPFQL